MLHKGTIKQFKNTKLFSFLRSRSLNIEKMKKTPRINISYILL